MMHLESSYHPSSEDAATGAVRSTELPSSRTGRCTEPDLAAERLGADLASGGPRGGVHALPDALRPLAGLGARLPYCPRRDLRALCAEIQLHTARCIEHGI